jgi:hypothetical protein
MAASSLNAGTITSSASGPSARIMAPPFWR